MIAWSATIASSPLHVWLGHSSPLKRQASSFCKRHFFPFRRSCGFSSPSFFCDCPVDQNGSHHRCAVALKAETFIEEKLTDVLAERGGSVHQIVLLTDGEDLTPCRHQWAPLTVIFHISTCPVPPVLEVPKSCLVRYVHGELEDSVGPDGWTDRLRNAGYQGNKPSVWLVQGINFEAESKLRRIIECVSGLIMQGSLLIGGIDTNIGGLSEDACKQLLEKILVGCGFRVKSVLYSHTSDGSAARMLFVAEQLLLSDEQVDYAKKEMELAEESGDEESFEDWL